MVLTSTQKSPFFSARVTWKESASIRRQMAWRVAGPSAERSSKRKAPSLKPMPWPARKLPSLDHWKVSMRPVRGSKA